MGCTAGDGVNNGKRYTDLLESRLEGAEVLNFGMPGSGPDQQYLAYQTFAHEIDYAIGYHEIKRYVRIARKEVGQQGQDIIRAKGQTHTHLEDARGFATIGRSARDSITPAPR